MTESTMRISEIFYSIQGEGRLTGVPSVFVRTSGCNLHCRWCDTPYSAWERQGDTMTVAAIMTTVRRHPTRFCVLTGGEPMLATGIHDLAAALRDAGKHITIETAGTRPPAGIACDLASVSPKLANSTPDHDRFPDVAATHDRRRLQPDIVREWLDRCDCQLKFVIETAADITAVQRFLDDLNAPVRPENVLLMPQATDRETMRRRAEPIVEACLRLGYRYCQRLHVELFGNRRGV